MIYLDKTNTIFIRSKNASFESQQSNLKQIETNLKDILSYVENQKAKLQESEDLVNKLNSEKQKLEVLVKADRNIINAIFDFQEKNKQKELWIGYIVSFILGVLSSLTAMLIGFAIKSKKQNNIIPKKIK